MGNRTEFRGTWPFSFIRLTVPVVKVGDVLPLAEPHHGHPHHPQLGPGHLAGDWQEPIFSLSVRVEELDVPDALHQAAPDPASLPCLVVGGVVVVVIQVLHLMVGCSVPVVKP